MDKIRVLVIAGLVLVILVASITVVFLVRNNNEEPDNGDDMINPNVKVTGNLQDYINALTDNYYIKYSGKFRNNSGELVSAVVEYTKDGKNFALRSSELNMHMMCEQEKLYSISYDYKMIITMSKQSFDISEYNLVSDINQIFVKSYKESINSTEYDVEEYLFNGKTLKYYFKDSDIKLIRYDGGDIKIIRLEKKTNSELLVKPDGYTSVQA